MNSLRKLILVLAVLPAIACGGGGSSSDNNNGNSEPTDVSFSGEQAAIPDYSYDTGWLPDGSPIQVKLLFNTAGKLTAVADAVVGGSSDAPIISGKAGTGLFKMSVLFQFQVLLKADVSVVQYEGPVDENADIVFEFGGEAAFDPFLLDAEAIIVADVPETQLASIPLAASIPGVDINVIVHIAGTVTSKFSGACAAVNDSEAHYTGTTFTVGNLILKPSVSISALMYEETLDAFDIPVEVPETALTMDLGTVAVTPGGGAVDGGGSLGTVGSCDGTVIPPSDVTTGEEITEPSDVTEPEDTISPEDTVTPSDVTPGSCADTCPGCCDGETCLPGADDAVCGADGATCSACADGSQCVGGECQTGPYDCATQCPGCCFNNQCASGNDDKACGSAGIDCFSCGAAEVCYSGGCEAKPYDCESECGGCCFNNECFDGYDDDKCGYGGEQCKSCSGNKSCSDQVCVDLTQDCWQTCDGCCDDAGDCWPGNDLSACGTAGYACEMCPLNHVCSLGACSLNLEATFDVWAFDGEVLYSPDGGWDEFAGDPDPYVEIKTYYNESEGYLLTGVSFTDDDTTFPYWNQPILFDIPAGDLLEHGLAVHLYDADLAWDDSIGSCSFLLAESDFDGDPKGSCGSFGDFEVRYVLQPSL
jgi:hypothetical protein